MNKTFNLVWSAVRGAYIVAHECAKFGGRPSRAGQTLRAAGLTLSLLGGTGLALAGPPTPAVPAPNALPTAGQVVAGSASIAQSANRMDVTQSSQKAAINWQSFNIGAAAQVNFAQPNASAVALNRVLSSDPSAIYGKLTANGQVFLINQAGVLFGAGSRVDVGGLVASTMNVTDADFMAGSYKFASGLGSNGMGSVLNLGNITAAQGGYVALLAPEVRNEGVITASLGQVVLGAADAVTLSMDASGLQYAVDQGAVQALVDNKGLVQAEGGQVLLSARAANTLASAVINNSGTIEAKGLSSVGGKIVLEADSITLASGSTLDASGATGGGTVLVGGDWQGSGAMHQATMVTMEQGASIDASAKQSGNGGKVVLWSDIHNANSVTKVDGEILAMGGGDGGDGGHIETSAASVDVGPNAVFNTLAPKGQTGWWLLDPYDYTIGATQAASIVSGLASSNVSIQTSVSTPSYGSSGNSANTGNIAVNSAIDTRTGVLSKLAVTTGGSGYLTAPTVTISGGGGTGATATATVSGGVVTGITITSAGTGYTGTPTVSFTGGSGTGAAATATSLLPGQLATIAVANGGSGYSTAPTVAISGGGGTGATGTAIITGGVVTGINITSVGSGYLTAPTITLTGGSGTGATATSTVPLPTTTTLSMIAAGKISVSAPITVGSLALDGSGAGNSATTGIELATTVTTSGAQSYTGKVAIAGNTTVNSISGGVTFSNTLDNLAGTELLTGSSSWLIPTNITSVSAWAIGGGGGGGASQSAAGGGAGGVAYQQFTTTPGQIISYSTGAVGTGYLGNGGGSNGNGTAGGTTTLTYANAGVSLTANGGGGGTSASSGGTGGTASGGTANVPGGNGGSGNGGDSTAGAGGGIGGGNGGNGGAQGGGPVGGTSLDVSGLGAALALVNQTLGVGGVGGLSGGFNCTGCAAGSATNFGAGGGGQSWYGHLTQANGLYGGGGGGGAGEGSVGNGGNGGAGVVVVKYSVSPSTLTINAGSGTVSFANKVGSLANLANLNITTTGNISFNNTVNATALATSSGGATTFAADVKTAGAVSLTSNSLTVNGKIDATAGNITVNTDALTLGAAGRFQSTGALTVAPKSTSTTIGIAGATGTLALPASYFSTNFVDGFSSITVGRSDGTGNIAANAFTFYDPLTLLSGGAGASANLSGGITDAAAGTTSGSLTVKVGQDIITAGSSSITTHAQPVVLWSNFSGAGGYIQLGTSAPITTNGGALWLGGGSGSTTWNSLTVGNGYAQGRGAAMPTGIFISSGAISTAGGNIAMYGQSASSAISANDPAGIPNACGIETSYANQYSINSGSGSILLNGIAVGNNGAFSSEGVYLNGGSMTSTAGTGTAISITGDASGVSQAGASHGAGVVMVGWSAAKPNTIQATGGGSIVITGTAGSDANVGDYSSGVRLADGTGGVNTLLTSGGTGSITLTGSASDTGANSYSVTTGVTDIVTSSGTLVVNGTGRAINLLGKNTVTGTTTLGASGQAISAANTLNNFVGLTSVSAGANITLLNSAAMALDAVTSTGTVDVETLTGNLTVSGNLSSTDTSANAVLLNAGKNTAAGTSTGGNIVLSSSPTITTGSGGRATLMTGAVAGSTGLTALVGSGSGNFRYNSDEATSGYDTLGAALGSGTYAIYRERPSVNFTVANASMVYGDAAPSLPLNISGGVNGDTVAQIFKTSPNLTIGGSKSTSGNYIVVAGGHALSATGGTDRLGYNLGAITGLGTLTVTGKPVTVAGITAPDKTYDGLTSVTPVATGASVTGLVTGDVLSIAATTGAFADKNAGMGKTVTVSGISFSGTDSANYSPPSSVTTTASILQKALTVTGSTAASRAYDGTLTATLSGGTLSGVIAADTANVSLTQAGSFASKNVGTGIVVTAADTLGGTAATNYSLTQPTGLSANITVKALTITGLAGTNRTYDGSTIDALTGSATLVGLVTGETLTIGGTASGTLASPNAGSEAVTTAVTLADYLTFKASNYSLTQPTLASVTIGKRIVNLTGNRAYDGTTAVANSIFSLSNLVSGEALTLTGSGTVANKHVGTGKLVTLGSLALGNGTNGLANNYTLTGGTDVAAFTAAPLTLTSSNVSKTYDGTTSAAGTAAVATGSTLFSGDALSGGTFAFTDPNAGSGNKAVTVSGVTAIDGNGGADYTVSYTNNTTSTIDPKPLSSTFSGVVTKPYDADPTANIASVTWNVIGAIAGETITLTGATARPATGTYADANAGNGKAVTGTLTSDMFAAGSGTLLANYTLPTSSTGYGDITKRPIIITPAAQSKTYGVDSTGNVGVGKATFAIGGSGMAGGQAIGSVTLASAGATATAHRANGDLGMGHYSITASAATGGTFSAANYAISYAPGTLTVNQAGALTVTANDAGKTYGDVKNFSGTEFKLTGGSLLPGDSIASVQLTSAGSAAIARRADGNLGVGSYAINAANATGGSGTDLANDYAGVNYLPGILTVTPRAITVTASDWAKTYGQTLDLATVGYVASGLVNGDLVTGVTMGVASDTTTTPGTPIPANLATAASGSYTLTPSNAVFSVAAAADYTVSAYNPGTLKVDPLVIVLVANSASKMYGNNLPFAGTEYALGSGWSLVSGDTLDATNGMVIASTGAAVTSNVASYLISLSGTPLIKNGVTDVTASYKISLAPGTLTVTPRPITITPAAQTKVYGDSQNLGSTGFTVGGSGLVNSDVVSAVSLASTGAVAAAHAGSYDITDSGAVFSAGYAANYAINYTTATNALTVNPLTVTITANNATKTYGDNWASNVGTGKTAFTLVRTNGNNSGAGFLPNSDSISGVTLASSGAVGAAHRTVGNDGGGAGLWDITPSAAQTATPGDYTFAYVAGKLNITPKTITTTVVNQATTYGTAATTSSAVSGTINGDSLTTGIAAYADTTPVTIQAKTAAGNYTLRADGNLTGTYAADYVLATTGNTDGQWVVSPKTVTASLSGSVSKVYDGTVAISNLLSGNYTIASGIEIGDSITLNNPSSGVYDNKNATTGKLVSVSGLAIAGGTGASNYQLASTSASGNIGIVTAKPVTLTAPVVSRSYNSDVTYSTSNADLAALSFSLVGGDTVSAATMTYTNKDVGSGNKTVTLDSASVNDGNGGGNYTVTRAGNSTSSITPALLTITAGSTAKIYGQTLTFIGTEFTSVGLQGGETVGSVSLTSNGTGNAASKGFYPIVASAATGGSFASSNYNLQYVNGTLTVAAAQINVTANISGNPTKVYDGSTTATLASSDYTLTGFVNGEAATITKALGNYGSPNTGTSTVTVSGLSFSDYLAAGSTDLTNYVLPAYVTGLGTITAKPLTLAATASNKQYDGNLLASVSGYGLTGLVGQQTLIISSTAANFNSKDVLTANTVTISGIGLADGTDANAGLASNYSVANTTIAAAQITPKAMTISGITAANKVYDGSFNAIVNVSGAQYAGLVGSDDVNVLVNGAFVDKNVGTRSVALTSHYTGADISNYTIVDQAATTANITTKALTMSGLTVAASKVYDTSTNAVIIGTPALVTAESLGSGSIHDGAPYAGDNVTLSGTPVGTYDFKDVLTASQVSYSGLSLTGPQASNYNLVTLNAVGATITPKPLTMSGLSVPTSKVYDANTTAVVSGTSSLSGSESLGHGSASDGLWYSGDSLHFTGSAIGTYNNQNVLGAGSVTFSGLALDNSNYSLTIQSPASATITPKTVGLSAVKTYDGSTSLTGNVTITTGVGSETLTYIGATASDKNVATAGKYISGIALSDGSNGGLAANYQLPALTSAQTGVNTVAIDPKSITLAAPTISKTFDNTTDFTATSTELDNLSAQLVKQGVSGDTVTAVTLTYDNEDAGTANHVVAPTLATISSGNSNYTLNYATSASGTILRKEVALAGLSGVNKTYDGTTAMPLGTNGYGALVGVVDTAPVTLSGVAVYDNANASNTAGDRVVLRNDLALQGPDANNYTLTWTNGSGSIAKAPLTVSANADAKFVTQSDVSGYNAVSYSGFVHGETTSALDISRLTISRSNASQNAAGTYGGVLVPDGVTAGNYAITFSNGAYTIVPADQLLVRVQNTATTYGTSPSYTVTGAQYLKCSLADCSASGSVNTIGTLTTASSIGTSFTYSDGASGTASFMLGPVAPQASGAGQLKVGNYAIGASSISESNANFSNNLVVVGSLSVSQKSLTPTASNVSKVYDGDTSMNAVTLGLNGLVSGDTVTVSGNGTFTQSNVGSNLGYTISLVTLGSADSGNYYLGTGNTFTGSDGAISRKTVSISGSRTYDGSTTMGAGTVQIATGVAGETLTYSNATADTKNVSSSNFIKTITLGDNPTDATDPHDGWASNYQLPDMTVASASNAVTFAKKDLSISGITAADKVYDGSSVAAVSVAGATASALQAGGMVTGDNFTVAATGNFRNAGNTANDKNVGVGKTVLLVSSYGGADLGNYAITEQATAAASINKKDLSISGITASDKVYDGNNLATVNTANVLKSGLVSGDDLSVAATGTFSDKNAATGKTVSLVSTHSGTDVGNYQITDQATTTASITPKNLTVDSVSAANKTYDGLTNAVLTLGNLLGLVSNESLALSGKGDFDNANVGIDKTVLVQLALANGTNGLASNYKISDTTTKANVNPVPNVVPPLPPSVPNAPLAPPQVPSPPPPLEPPPASPANPPGMPSGPLTGAPPDTDTTGDTPTGTPVGTPAPGGTPTTGGDPTGTPAPSGTPTTGGEPTGTPTSSNTPASASNVDGNAGKDTASSGTSEGGSGANAAAGSRTDDVPATSDGSVIGTAGFISVRTFGELEVQAGTAFSYQLPEDTFKHADPKARITLIARSENGRSLPIWLRFNPNTRRFTGKPPATIKQLVVIVVAKDTQGNQATTRQVLKFGK